MIFAILVQSLVSDGIRNSLSHWAFVIFKILLVHSLAEGDIRKSQSPPCIVADIHNSGDCTDTHTHTRPSSIIRSEWRHWFMVFLSVVGRCEDSLHWICDHLIAVPITRCGHTPYSYILFRLDSWKDIADDERRRHDVIVDAWRHVSESRRLATTTTADSICSSLAGWKSGGERLWDKN